MIVKTKHGEPPADKFGKAGFEAEKQMAYYLRVAFEHAEDVFVFNDIRFVHKGHAAQIDHLLLHRFGFFLIESKSVSTRIEVNKHLEFTRVFGGSRQGMDSPIHQVKRQAEVLARILNENKEKLRRKVLFGLTQCYFGDQRFEKLVAISGHGEIVRKGCDPTELLKADAIVARIRERIEKRQILTGIKGTLRHALSNKPKSKEFEKDYLTVLTDQELVLIRDFLKANHQPLRKPKPPQAPPLPQSSARETVAPKVAVAPKPAVASKPAVAPPTASHIHSCRHCDSSNLKVAYGRYGYYFKCVSCSGNTKIDFTCRCGEKAKISKRGNTFSWKCSCGNDALFFENKE